MGIEDQKFNMFCSFSGNQQVVCSILDLGRDKNYLVHSKGLNFGVNNTFMATSKCGGFSLVNDPFGSGKFFQEKILKEQRWHGLIFHPPTILGLKYMLNIIEEIKGIFCELIVLLVMSDEVG